MTSPVPRLHMASESRRDAWCGARAAYRTSDIRKVTCEECVVRVRDVHARVATEAQERFDELAAQREVSAR